MEELKIGYQILQVMGYGIYGWALVINWGDIKSVILFILAIIFASFKAIDAFLNLLKKKLNLRILNERQDVKEMQMMG